MSGRGMRSAQLILATAVVAAIGLFLLVVNLGEHRSESRLLIETILFLPLLLLWSMRAVHARRS
jgi:hypothetical protein